MKTMTMAAVLALAFCGCGTPPYCDDRRPLCDEGCAVLCYAGVVHEECTSTDCYLVDSNGNDATSSSCFDPRTETPVCPTAALDQVPQCYCRP